MRQLLLTAVLADGSRATEAFDAWRGRIDLQKIDTASQRLLPSLTRHLADDELSDQIRRVLRFTWLRSQLLISAAGDAASALSEVGVPPMMIKGAAVLHHTGWDLALRPMEDIDLAIPIACVGRAVTALRAAGFDSPYARTLLDDPDRITTALHAVAFVGHKRAEVDLHWHVLKESKRAGADDLFWARSEPATVRGETLRVTSREDTLLLVIANGVGTLDSNGLQWATDAAVLLAGVEMDWNYFGRQARAHRLAGQAAVGLRILREYLPAQIPIEVVHRLRRIDIMHRRPRPPAVVRDLVDRAGRQKRHHERIGPSDVLRAERQRRLDLVPSTPVRGRPIALGEVVRFGLDADGRAPAYLLGGWHFAEPDGTWTRDRRAAIAIPLAEPVDHPLEVVLRCTPFLTVGSPRRDVVALVDGRKAVGQSFVGAELHVRTLTAQVPAMPQRSLITIEFRVPRPVRPRDVGYNGDPRRLGVNLVDIEVRRVG